MTRLLAIASFLLSSMMPLSLGAQENPRTILVLDASGSMWGQVDGKAKITIAQEVISSLLQTIPADQALGLTAYGHRRKGDCGDIESLVAPGLDTRASIAAAVNGIKPKGKTPLSAAVVAAAEELKYTEEAATVILVSDGRETCDFDPCEVGRRLEEAGVNFTAHVIGFDVAKQADRAQLQCLAENTGGTFKTASNAAELTQALEVVAKPQPPVERSVRFEAIEGERGPRITADLLWTLTNLDSGEVVMDLEAAGHLDMKLLPGNYRVEVLRSSNETDAAREIRVSKNTDTTVTLVLPLIIPEAELNAVETAVVGDTISVDWTGPDDQGDYLAAAAQGAKDSSYRTYSYTRGGAPLGLRVPPDPGSYEIRYIHGPSGRVLARKALEVTPLTVTLSLPDEVFAGASVPVEWDGPDYEGDYLSAAPNGADQRTYLTYSYTRAGSPVGLQMPAEPGTYEIRYVMGLGPTVLGSKTVLVKPVAASLNAAEIADAGETLEVQWEGPNYQGDYLSVAEIGAPKNSYENYSYTRHGSPLGLVMPVKPGDYEIRYVMNQNQTVLATKRVTVQEVGARITAPARAKIGETVEVNWTGPDYDRDYISVHRPDEKNYLGYVYARHGSPARLVMPLLPGQYEIRYVQNQDTNVLARQMIEVEPLEVNLTAPTTAAVGSTIEVTWDGPDYERDYVAVASVGDRVGKYFFYSYTRHGSPSRILMPGTPGDYEIRYIANGSPDRVMRAVPIRIEAVDMGLAAASETSPGSMLEVTFSGPVNAKDYIAVGKVGDKRYSKYVYATEGSGLTIEMPETPGDYEIRYVLNAGDTVIARVPVSVK